MRAKSHQKVAFTSFLVLACGFACGAGETRAPQTRVESPPNPLGDIPAPSFDYAPHVRADGRLTETATPERYQLDMRVDPKQTRFSGTATVDVQARHGSVRFVVMHSQGLKIKSVSDGRLAKGHEYISQAEWQTRKSATGNEDELVILLPRSLPDQNVSRLRIEFEGGFADDLAGLYTVHDDGLHMAVTHFEPMDARRAFPCFDEPAVKIPYSVSIAAPKGMAAFANASLLSQENFGEESVFHFKATPPIPSYLVAFAVGNIEAGVGEKIDDQPTPDACTTPTCLMSEGFVRTLALTGRAKHGVFAAKEGATLLRRLRDYTAIRYPYGKLDLIGVPNFGAGAMENPGLVTFREERLLVPKALQSKRTLYGIQTILAHELAHQWFGNYVTAKWWNEIWLNEAFATWMEAHLLDEMKPGAILDWKASVQKVMDLDGFKSTRAVREPVSSTAAALEAFDALTYEKGSAVLRMAEQAVGPNEFRKGMQRYLREHAFSSASTDDFWAAMDKETAGKTSAIARSFVDEAGVPIVGVAIDCASGTGGPASATYSLARWNPAGITDARPAPWRVPVCTSFDGVDKCVEVTKAGSRVALERCPKSVLPNPLLNGYYRFRLDHPENVPVDIASASPAGRISYISSLIYNLKAVSPGYSPAFVIQEMARLRYDKDPYVIGAYVNALRELHLIGKLESLGQASDVFFRTMLADAAQIWPLERAGLIESETDARRAVLLALADLAHKSPKTESLMAMVRGGAEIDDDQKALALELVARVGNRGVWTELVQSLKKNENPQARVAVIKSLAAFSNETLFAETMALVVKGIFRLQDVRYIFSGAFSNPASREMFLEWIPGHASELIPILTGHNFGRVSTAVAQACDSKTLEALELVLAKNEKLLEGWGRSHKMGVEAAQSCSVLRTRFRSELEAAVRSKPAASRR